MWPVWEGKLRSPWGSREHRCEVAEWAARGRLWGFYMVGVLRDEDVRLLVFR